MINKKFLNKKDYIKFVKYSDVFISPRKQEGIGMSFLEAMSLGKYIVAINDSTMNEYILNRKIGLLISNETSKINSYFIKKNYYYRMNISRKLYLEWLKNKEKIKLFFNEPISRSKFNFFIFIKIKLISVLFYIKKILKKFLL
jgi:Glycosyltransferase